jgi:hypothetical protein
MIGSKVIKSARDRGMKSSRVASAACKKIVNKQ